VDGTTRWKCICAYDGTDFDGWQSQPSGRGVQDALESALGAILKRFVRIHGSGRTDAGVHASGQVFHFDAAWEHGANALIRAMHTRLPETIALRSLRPAPDDFHARFSVTGKRYIYRFYRGRPLPRDARFVHACPPPPLDMESMRRAAAKLIGAHDFSAFAARPRGEADPNPVKTVRRLELRARGRHITLTAEASGYLYRMARSIAGALYEVGRGRIDPESLARAMETGRRPEAIVSAPARGLSLERVFY